MKTYLHAFFLIQVFLILHFFEINAQVVSWAKNSVAGHSKGISVDANGNSFILGWFNGTATFGTFQLTGLGGENIFLAKYSPNGNCIWAKQAWSFSSVFGNSITVDANGNSYITGYFVGTTTFGTIHLTGYGNQDIFIAKYDPDGNCLWAKQVGCSGNDVGNGISVDLNGDCYLSGNLGGDVTIDSNQLTNGEFIAKYDPDGNCLWAKQAAKGISVYSSGISFDANGNKFLAGYFHFDVLFGLVRLSSYGEGDIYIAKYDPDGNCLWAKQAGGTNPDACIGISTDANGNSYVTGYFIGSATFGSVQLTSYGSQDIFIAKYDPDGNCLWAKQAGGLGNDNGNSIAIDANGNSYVTGSFQATASFGTCQINSLGGYDIYIAKYDPDGNCLWAKQAGNTNMDIGSGIILDSKGHIFITGNLGSTSTFDLIQLIDGGMYVALVLDESNPLPVEIISFSASTTDKDITLQWKTATEVNNYGFDVERKGLEWEKIGFVNGHRNSNSPKEYSFTDEKPLVGKIQYRIKQLDNDGKFKYYEPITVNVDAPKEFKLMQNSPNPFNPTTAIKFQLPMNSFVTVKVFDMIGREVATLVNEEKPAGSHIIYWNGKDNHGLTVSSGVYLYKLSAGSYIETRKMNFLK